MCDVTHHEGRVRSSPLHNLMTHLPVFGTLAMAALLTGPLARLPIDAGAWILERCLTGASETAE